MRREITGLAVVGLFTGTAAAQCRVASGSNEGKLLAFYTAPIIFATATAPQQMHIGGIRIGIEGEYIPKPNPEIQKTGKCFLQKTEHTSLSPIFGRPRLTIGLPGGMAFEASYLPPVKIADATPNLASVALSHIHHFGMVGPEGINVMLRGNATFGNVKGPITCPRSALQMTTPTAPCYGSTPSNDTFKPDMYGIDVLAGLAPTKSYNFYGGVGANRIDPHFQVGFTDGSGQVDRTKVELDNPVIRLSITAGAQARVAARFDVGAQIYSIPQDVTTVRVHAGLNFR